MPAPKPPQHGLIAVQSEANPKQAQVYFDGALIATLAREGSGWRTAFYRSGQDEQGRSVWAPGPDREPRSLTVAADAAWELAAPKRDAA